MQQPLGGSLAGAVAIEGNQQLLGAMARKELELQRRDAGAKTCNGVGKAGLVELDHIQRPFHQQRATAFADGLLGLIQAKDQSIALKQEITAAVAVLGLLLAHGPAAESNGQA